MNKYHHIGCQVKGLADLYMKHIGYKTGGRFVEVGAFNGINWSNTRALALAGWHGLMIEPQQEWFAKCEELYKDNSRIILENCCAGDYNGKIKLYLGGSLTTTKQETVEVYNSLDWSRIAGLREDRFIECDVFTLDYLLFKHDWRPEFDVLVVDVEGAEMDVLDGFSLNWWQPTMAIVETHAKYPDERLSRKAELVDAYFADYCKVYEDHINSVYVNE